MQGGSGRLLRAVSCAGVVQLCFSPLEPQRMWQRWCLFLNLLYHASLAHQVLAALVPGTPPLTPCCTHPPCRRVINKAELREAIREMLDTPGPFLLDVMVPHIAHVLPMIPGGGSFKDTITEGDGSQKY